MASRVFYERTFGRRLLLCVSDDAGSGCGGRVEGVAGPYGFGLLEWLPSLSAIQLYCLSSDVDAIVTDERSVGFVGSVRMFVGRVRSYSLVLAGMANGIKS